MSEIFKPEISEEINRTRAILKKAEVFGAEETAKAFGIHPSSVWRLRKKVAEGGPACDRRRFNPGAASSVDGRRVEWALAFMAARQGAPLSVVCRELNKAAIREGWPETHYGALRRAIEKLPADMRTLLAKGGNGADR